MCVYVALVTLHERAFCPWHNICTYTEKPPTREPLSANISYLICTLNTLHPHMFM